MRGLVMVTPLVLVIALGALLRRLGVLKQESIPQFNNVLYWGVLPILLFRTTLKVGEGLFSNPNLFIAVHVSFLVVPGVAWLLASFFCKDRKRVAVSVLISIRANNIFMGIPAITLALGEPGFEALSLFFAVGLLGYNLISITWAQVALVGGVSLRAVLQTVKQLLKNPLIWGCFLGVSGSALGVHELPGWLDSAFGIVGDTASGLALIALGASLRFHHLGRALSSTWRDCLFKLFAHPAMVWAAFSLWPVDRTLQLAVVLVSAMPAAINNFVVAQGMGMDSDYAAEVVAASTLLSVISLPIWIAVLGI